MDKNKIFKAFKVVLWALLIVSLILAINFYLRIPKDASSSVLDITLGWAYILFGIGIALAVIFPLAKAFTSKKGILSLLIGLVVIVVIVGGAYLLAPGTPVETNAVQTPGSLKLTDTALYVTYLLLALTLVTLIGTWIVNAIRNR